MAFQPLAKAVGEPRKSFRCHADREVLPLDVACRDLLRLAHYRYAPYSYYGGRRVAARCFGYIQVGYAVGLVDDAVRGALAESIADRILIRVPPVSRNLWRTDDALAQVFGISGVQIAVPMLRVLTNWWKNMALA